MQNPRDARPAGTTDRAVGGADRISNSATYAADALVHSATVESRMGSSGRRPYRSEMS